MHSKTVMAFRSETFNMFAFNGKMVLFNSSFLLTLSKFGNLIYMTTLFIKKSKARFEKAHERPGSGTGRLNTLA